MSSKTPKKEKLRDNAASKQPAFYLLCSDWHTATGRGAKSQAWSMLGMAGHLRMFVKPNLLSIETEAEAEQ